MQTYIGSFQSKINSMTRKEQKIEKLKKEKEFIESCKGKYLNQQEKSKFRSTSFWVEFRKKFCNSLDALTHKKLGKRFNLHHMLLDARFYTELNMNRFIPLSSASHDFCHWFYGYYRKDRDIIKRLKKIMDRMVELNDGKDICDYRKEMKNRS